MIIKINEEVNKSEHKDISYRIWKRHKRGNKWVFMILPYSIEISLVISLFCILYLCKNNNWSNKRNMWSNKRNESFKCRCLLQYKYRWWNGLCLYIVKQILNTLDIAYSFNATERGMKFTMTFK